MQFQTQPVFCQIKDIHDIIVSSCLVVACVIWLPLVAIATPVSNLIQAKNEVNTMLITSSFAHSDVLLVGLACIVCKLLFFHTKHTNIHIFWSIDKFIFITLLHIVFLFAC